MALDVCVRQILCTLSAAVLGALADIIRVQQAILNARIATAQAQLLALDVATAPVEVARNIANNVLNQAQGAATLVPLGLISGCADLGDFNVDLVSAIDDAQRELNDLADDLNRLLSYKEELQALVDELTRIIEQFDQVLLVLQECAQT